MVIIYSPEVVQKISVKVRNNKNQVRSSDDYLTAGCLSPDNWDSMVSDSNKTKRKSLGIIEDDPYEKTKYFEKQAIGVSVWGELTINKIDFWDWFEKEMDIFFKDNDSNPKFGEHLAKILNNIITEENKTLKAKKELGIHLAFFYKTEESFRPSIFHITNKRINGEITHFIGQPDQFPLPENDSFYLINGAYEPFSVVYKEYIKFSRKIRRIVEEKVKNNENLLNIELNNREELLTKECESIIATIRLYQSLLEMSKIKRFIGGPINAICFTEKGLIEKYCMDCF